MLTLLPLTLAAALAFGPSTLISSWQEAAPAPPPAADACTSVDELLARLESSGSDIRDFRAALSYEKFDRLLDEAERRFGRVVLEGSGKARRFAFLFEKFYDASGREETLRDHWIYADGWIAELDQKHRIFTKRQIVEPGKTFDPLKLGEGPFPLPLGQSKAEVVSRFEASLCEVPDLPMLKSLREVCGLRLVPKADTALAKDTERVEVFYDRTTFAPRAVVMWAKNGDRTTVLLSSPALNAGLSVEDRELLRMPEPDPRLWAIDIRPWQGPKDESALTQPSPPAAPPPDR